MNNLSIMNGHCIEDANRMFDRLNQMWAQVEQKISQVGCLRPFIASLDGKLKVEKCSGKWRVCFINGEKTNPILDANFETRILYLNEIETLFELLERSNLEAVNMISIEVDAAERRFKESMEKIFGTNTL